MVTTRAGSRAASESLGSPAPKRVSAKGTPKGTPRGTPKGTPKGTPLKKTTKSPKAGGAAGAGDTPVTKAVKSALGQQQAPTASATERKGKSARRRAGQKSRLAALRAVQAVEYESVEPELRELLVRTLRQMLDKLQRGETICPSRVPRLLAAEGGEFEDWQALLPAMAAVVQEEGRIGKVEFVREGEVVSSAADGPVRVRRGKNF